MQTELQIPAFLELEDGTFASAVDAPVRQWREALRLEHDPRRRQAIEHMLTAAAKRRLKDHHPIVSVQTVKAAMPSLRIRVVDHGTFAGWNEDGTPRFRPNLRIVPKVRV